MQYLKDTKTNVVYNIYAFRSRPTHLNSTTQRMCILGNTYALTQDNSKDVNKEVDDDLKHIVWFCYRKNFDAIKLDSMSGELRTDSGWGCMIRVGQMMLYIFLNRLLNKEGSSEKRYAILRKYFKEHGKREVLQSDADKLEEILGNFENVQAESKEEHFVEGDSTPPTDADKKDEQGCDCDARNDESSGKLTIDKIVEQSERKECAEHEACENKSVEHKEEDFEPKIVQRIGSHDFSNMLFIDDQNSEPEEPASDEERSDAENILENKAAIDDVVQEEAQEQPSNKIAERTINAQPVDGDNTDNREQVLDTALEMPPTTIIAPNNEDASAKDETREQPAENIAQCDKLPIERIESTMTNADRKNTYDIFSLQNIVVKAHKFLDTVPGSWFRPTTFLIVIKKLIKRYFREVRVVNVIENTIMLGKIHKSVFGASAVAPTSVPDAIDELSTKKWSNKLLLSISTMLGLESMEPRYKYFLDTLMASKSFCGILGGRHQSAYYIIGNNDRGSYYYLDPHYVKDTVADFADPKVLDAEFFNKKLLEIEYSKLSTSVSLVFFLESCEDFEQLWAIMRHLEDYYKDDYFMSYMLNNDINEGEYAEDDIITF